MNLIHHYTYHLEFESCYGKSKIFDQKLRSKAVELSSLPGLISVQQQQKTLHMDSGILRSMAPVLAYTF